MFWVFFLSIIIAFHVVLQLKFTCNSWSCVLALVLWPNREGGRGQASSNKQYTPHCTDYITTKSHLWEHHSAQHSQHCAYWA